MPYHTGVKKALSVTLNKPRNLLALLEYCHPNKEIDRVLSDAPYDLAKEVCVELSKQRQKGVFFSAYREAKIINKTCTRIYELFYKGTFHKAVRNVMLLDTGKEMQDDLLDCYIYESLDLIETDWYTFHMNTSNYTRRGIPAQTCVLFILASCPDSIYQKQKHD